MLNTSKTKEMVFDFRTSKRDPMVPVQLKHECIGEVKTFKYLGTVIDNELVLDEQCKTILIKAHQRMYFLRKMSQFHVYRQKHPLSFLSNSHRKCSIVQLCGVVWQL